MNSLLNDIGKYWLEWWGRNRPIPQYSFPDNEIVTPRIAMRVSLFWKAIYLNLHPTHYAIAIAPNGKVTQLKGGYNPLPAGQYSLHYVDKQNRMFVIPQVSEVTLDGAQISLKLVVTYQVIDPVKALEVQQSVNTLFIFIQSALKEFIRSHKYDEIVGSSDGHMVENEMIARYIKDQHISRQQISKLFFIANIVVEEQVGDPKLTEIRESLQIQQKQNIATSLLFKQKQDLEQKVAEQESEIKRIKAQSEVAQQDILQNMQLQKIELEKARMDLQVHQAKTMRAMDAIVQAVSVQTYPRDQREVEIIKELLRELGGLPNPSPEASAKAGDNPAPEAGRTLNAEKIDMLTDTLLNWLSRKRS